jgi:hypothetical protein
MLSRLLSKKPARIINSSWRLGLDGEPLDPTATDSTDQEHDNKHIEQDDDDPVNPIQKSSKSRSKKWAFMDK